MGGQNFGRLLASHISSLIFIYEFWKIAAHASLFMTSQATAIAIQTGRRPNLLLSGYELKINVNIYRPNECNATQWCESIIKQPCIYS